MSPQRSWSVLGHVDYRRLWLGLLVSMTGSMLRNAAVLWHVTLLAPPDERALALGIVGLVRFLPIVVCSLFAGVLADAVDRRRLLLVVNAALLAVSTAMAVLTAIDAISLSGLYVLAALGAGASTFDNPARNAFFPILVPRHDIPRAIGLNGVAFQAAAVLGPALAGVVIASFGVAAAYAFDAATFAVILLLLRKIAPREEFAQRGSLSVAAAWQGVRFVFGHPLIRASLLLDFFAMFFASATSLLPIFAQDVLAVGAHSYGLLAAASGAGSALVSLVAMPLVERVHARGKALLWSVAVYGLMTIGFGLSTELGVSWLCLFAAGAADGVSTLYRQIIRQLETPDAMRGRMASVGLLFYMGGPQLGEVEAGLVAQAVGPVAAVVSGGIACCAVAAWTAQRSPVLRNHRSE